MEISARFCRKPGSLKNTLLHWGWSGFSQDLQRWTEGRCCGSVSEMSLISPVLRVERASPLPRAGDFSAVLPHIGDRAGKRGAFRESALPTSLWPFLPASEPLMAVCPSSRATSIRESSESFITALGHIFYHCLCRCSYLGQTSCITGIVETDLTRCPVLLCYTSGTHLRSPLSSRCHWR